MLLDEEGDNGRHEGIFNGIHIYYSPKCWDCKKQSCKNCDTAKFLSDYYKVNLT